MSSTGDNQGEGWAALARSVLGRGTSTDDVVWADPNSAANALRQMANAVQAGQIRISSAEYTRVHDGAIRLVLNWQTGVKVKKTNRDE